MCHTSTIRATVERCATAPAMEGWEVLFASEEKPLLTRVHTAALELLLGDDSAEAEETVEEAAAAEDLNALVSWVDVEDDDDEEEESLQSVSSVRTNSPYTTFSSADLKLFQCTYGSAPVRTGKKTRRGCRGRGAKKGKRAEA